MVEIKKFLREELPLYLVVAIMLFSVGYLAYEQGYYNGMDYVCDEEIVIDMDGIVYCGKSTETLLIDSFVYDWRVDNETHV